MNIKRTLDTTNATYDLTGLTKKQFSALLHCYERQMYIYHDKYMPENDELFNKLKTMSNSDTFVV